MARHKEFVREEALDRAMEAFWSQGYEATSIRDLVNRTGVSRASLYDTFGDKHSLFLAAMDRYTQVVVGKLLDLLERPGSGKRAIRAFFTRLVEHSLTAGSRRGCLVTNSAVERALHDRETAARVGACWSKMETAFYKALARARAAGEISQTHSLPALARYLTNSAQGLSVMGKACSDRSVLQDIVEVTLSALD